MKFLTVRETAEKWGVTPRQVQRFIANGRVPGAKKYGSLWFVPVDSEKPIDLRKLRKPKDGGSESRPECVPPREENLVFFPNPQIPKDPNADIEFTLPPFFPLRKATLDYYRGNFNTAKRCFRETEETSPVKLTAALLALAAAMVTVDYALYDEISAYLRRCLAFPHSRDNELRLHYPEYMAAASMGAPRMLPDWLRNGELSECPANLRPGFLQFHMECLRVEGKYEQLLAAAKTALSVYANDDHFTFCDLYYCLFCALAAYNLNDRDTSLAYIARAAENAMPHGFLVPFAEYVNGCGGLVEKYLEAEWPQQAKKVAKLAPQIWQNWIGFHNHYTQENITTILTPKEYHVAELLKNGATYAQAAQSLHLSTGRIRCIVSDIYGKLYINSKKELADFIL